MLTVKQYCVDSLVFPMLKVADCNLHMTHVGNTCMASLCNTQFYSTGQAARLGHHCGQITAFMHLAETCRVLYCPDQSFCQELLLDMCVTAPI